MAKLDQFNRTILHFYGAAQECGVHEFMGEALRLAQTSLHFDSGVVIQAALGETGMQIQAMHNYRQPVEKLHDRRKLRGVDPTLLKAIQQPGQCVTEELSNLDTRKYGDLIAYAKKYDVAQSLILVAPNANKRGAQVVSLWRAPHSKSYDKTSSRLGTLLLPHLLMAAKINQQRFTELPGSGHEGALMIADNNGCLRYVDEVAVAHLQHEWPEWSPPLLPSIFIDRLRGKIQVEWVGKRIHARLSFTDKGLYVRVSKRVIGSTLTPAESIVALLASRGNSYKSIAAELDVSLSTVRNHLHQVYLKLGVSGKTQLANHFASTGDLLIQASSQAFS